MSPEGGQGFLRSNRDQTTQTKDSYKTNDLKRENIVELKDSFKPLESTSEKPEPEPELIAPAVIGPFEVDLDFEKVEIQKLENLQPYYFVYDTNHPEDNIAEDRTRITFTPNPNIAADWEFENHDRAVAKKADKAGYFSESNGMISTSDETSYLRVYYPDFSSAFHGEVNITTEEGTISKEVFPKAIELPPVDITCGFEGADYICRTGIPSTGSYPNISSSSHACTIQDSYTGTLIKYADSGDMTMCNFGAITSTDFIVKNHIYLDVDNGDSIVEVAYKLDKQEIVN